MIVIKRTATTGYSQDPTKFFDFDRFANQCGDFVLIEGAFEKAAQWEQFCLSDEELTRVKAKKIIRLEFEEPNKFFIGDDSDGYDKDFYRIFTLCPYTSEWLNTKHNIIKRVPIFFPFNEEHIPTPKTKKYDIIYTGHIVSPKLLQELEIMANFKYRFVSNSTHSLVTNHSATYTEKMDLIAKTKITLVHNLLYPTSKHIKQIWRFQGWQNNHAFDLIPRPSQLWRRMTDRNVVVPQLKSRVFEAAFGRSLILCKRDPFNVIDRYFMPDKEFVYYDEGHFKEKVSDILANYHDYEPIIEQAYKRAIENYTTVKFVENYLEKLN